MPKQPQPRISGTTATVPIDSIEPNPWNPNVQSEFMHSKNEDSIEEFGFLDPVTVRSGKDTGPAFKKKQIIDGEHRWRAAKTKGLTEVLIVDVGRMSDAKAKTLTELLNKLRGENDPLRWTEMVESIKSEDADLLAFLPYKDGELQAMLASHEVDWDSLNHEPGDDHPSQQRDDKGKLYKKFSVSCPEATMSQAADLMRRIKAARKIDSDAMAFKTILDLAEAQLQTKRPSVVPPPPAPEPPKRKRKAA